MSAQSAFGSPLRVLYVIDSLAPGGAEVSLAAMAPGLIERGVQLDVVTLISRPGVQEQLRDAGATVTELQGRRSSWWRQVSALTREQRPDLVHTTLFEADIAGRVGARANRVPVVSTLANEAYGASHQEEHSVSAYRLRGAQLVDALTARLTARLHSVSAHVADVMAKRLRYPRRRIDVIPRGRDPEALGCRSKDRREGVRASLNISSDTPVVLAVARQEHQKGLDLLINAMPLVQQSVPGVRALVAGRQGAATATLEEQKRRTGAAIDFLGPRDDVPELLCAADVFVLPSRREGLPGALLEAMALECPAVVSDIPQHREVVDSTMALVVPADCPTALASAVASALSDSDAARERTRAGRRCFLSRFTIDAVTTEVVSFYERALGRSGRGDRG